MNYKKLGNTDLDVSTICLGTMTWGEQNTQEEGFEQMDYALDQGVNFWDTAEIYSVPPREETFGSTEEIIGNWFKKTKKRDKVILASKVCGIKVILHESNAFPGKVTRLLGRFCDEVALGFPVANKYLRSSRTIVTGTPVRSSFFLRHPLPSWVPQGVGPLIVVMGGSQGAVGLNHMFREVIPWLLNQNCRIVHITGNNDEVSTIKDSRFVERDFEY